MPSELTASTFCYPINRAVSANLELSITHAERFSTTCHKARRIWGRTVASICGICEVRREGFQISISFDPPVFDTAVMTVFVTTSVFGGRVRSLQSPYRGVLRQLPRRAAGCLSALLVSSMGQALAAGYYLPNQDAFATAKGNAFVATADSPAAVFYNPAGLVQLEQPSLSLGLYAVRLGNRVEIDGAAYTPKSEWQGVPHAFYAHPVSERLTLGGGLYSPYGLGNDWGGETPFRTLVTEARLRNPSATFALGYRLTDRLSLGGSVTLHYFDLRLAQGLGIQPNDYLRFEGDGWSLSGALSLLWQPHPQHAFGLLVGSGTRPKLDGEVASDLLGSASAELEFFTPLRILAGYSFRPGPGWNIEFDYDWLNWDPLNDLELTSANLPPAGRIALPFRWRSQGIFEIGVSYESDNGWRFAAGYDFNPNVQPDLTYSPGVADADLQWINAGFGRRLGDYTWFLGYQYGFSNHEVVGSLPSTAGETADGDYRPRHHSVIFSWQRAFD